MIMLLVCGEDEWICQKYNWFQLDSSHRGHSEPGRHARNRSFLNRLKASWMGLPRTQTTVKMHRIEENFEYRNSLWWCTDVSETPLPADPHLSDDHLGTQWMLNSVRRVREEKVTIVHVLAIPVSSPLSVSNFRLSGIVGWDLKKRI